MDPNRLWAKRWTGDGTADESTYVPGHLRDVFCAAKQVLRATAEAQLGALRLASDAWRERLHRVVLLAAALHDLGKCNDQFQNMLRQRGRQRLRHEWVTLLIVDDAQWSEWLMPAVKGDATDWDIVRWCIAGHHPRHDRSAPPELASDGPTRMRLLLNHDDVRAAVDWLRETFGLGKSDVPELAEREIDLGLGGSNEHHDLCHRHFAAEDVYDGFEPDLRRFIAAAKNCLVAADVAGSAIARKLDDRSARSAWVGEVLDAGTLPQAADYRRILSARLNCDPDEASYRLRAFQREAGDSTERVTFIKAGCGTGKTLAAYRWAETHCAGRRLYICYPTTGTATEGFRDYLLDLGLAEHVKTDLMHSRRKVDFEHILYADEDRNDAVARIESLDLWRVPVVACTVDTALGVVQNNRRGLFGWPALAQGGFVFDEIHSYDAKLFDALLHFLDAVRGVPVLLMTASIPRHRLQAIQHVLDRGGETLAEVEGPQELEQRPRYHAQAVAPNTIVARITEEVAGDGTVLRICNTVGAAMREAELLEEAGLQPVLYHSRFRYMDRVEQHKRVIEAFNGDGPAIAVCTQVAEMSLDLSATLLVTDLAPVPALIQRLGRLNRRAEEGDPTRPFIVTEPRGPDGKPSPLPYDADDLTTAQRWLDDLSDGDLSQADLAAAWETRQDASTEVSRWLSAWLDFGPATPVLELREGSPNRTVVLEEDWDDLKARNTTLAEVALPMPAKRGGRPFQWQAGAFKGVPVARGDAIEYDPERGARWAT